MNENKSTSCCSSVNSLCSIISFITEARETQTTVDEETSEGKLRGKHSAGEASCFTSRMRRKHGTTADKVNTSEQEEHFFLPLGSEEAPRFHFLVRAASRINNSPCRVLCLDESLLELSRFKRDVWPVGKWNKCCSTCRRVFLWRDHLKKNIFYETSILTPFWK